MITYDQNGLLFIKSKSGILNVDISTQWTIKKRNILFFGYNFG